MGKKKAKGGKKAKKIVDGISTAEMTREQLIGHVRRLQNEVDREREERNFFMLEREKLFSLWSLALEKITAEKDKARAAEIHLDDANENKEKEITSHKQKIRYLMSDHLNRLAESRLDYLHRVKNLRDEFWKIEAAVRSDASEARTETRTIREDLFETVRNLQAEHAKHITEMRNEFSKETRRIEVDCEIKIMNDRQVQHLESKQDLILLQVTKDEQIHDIIQTHEQQLVELKNYFRELTVNNLAVISSLKDELLTKRAVEENLQNVIENTRSKCIRLEKQLVAANEKMVEWTVEQKKMASRIKQVQRMDKKMEIQKRQTQLVDLANETLIQQNFEMDKKVELMKQTMGKAIMEMQMKSTMKRILVQMHQYNKSIAQQTQTDEIQFCELDELDNLE